MARVHLRHQNIVCFDVKNVEDVLASCTPEINYNSAMQINANREVACGGWIPSLLVGRRLSEFKSRYQCSGHC